MVQTPYPLVGTLQSLPSGVQITGKNLTSGGTEQVYTANDGSFIVDPANMGTYSDGDIIRIYTGTWYIDVTIDLTNFPGGKVGVNVDKPVKVSITRIKGTSLQRGISCGSTHRHKI